MGWLAWSAGRRAGRAQLVALLLAGAVAPLWAGALPPAVQTLLLVKLLAYDQKLAARTPKAVTVVVLYRDGDKESEAARREMVSALEAVAAKDQVAGLPLRVGAAAYKNGPTLEAQLTAAEASAVYLAAGLEGDLATILAVTRKRAVISVCATEEGVKQGVSVGLLLGAEGKPSLLINLPSSRAEGAKLDAALLRIARIL